MSKVNNPNPKAKPKPVRKKASTKAVSTTSNSWIKYAFLVGIVIVTYIAFKPALKNNITNWDDNRYILDNLQLTKPLGECAKYFFSNFFFSNYHPLTMIVYAIEFHYAKPVQAIVTDPAVFHLVNVLLHLLNVMLVFWFIYLLSGKKLEVAVFVSMLFGIHPMHVESVAWIAELKDVLFTFFFLLALISYYKYLKPSKAGASRDIKFYLLAIVLFILSGLSKPAAVTFSLVLPLLDYYTKRKFDKSFWLDKIPFLLISLVLGVLTFKAQQGTAIAKFETFTIFQRVMFGCYSMLMYLYKFFLPINLSALYPYPHLEGTDLHLPTIFYIAPFIVILIFALVIYSIKYTRLVVFGFLFFLVNIILVLQFLSVGIALVAERYSYIPYIGLFFIVGMMLSWVYRNSDPSISNYKSLVIAGSVIIFIACAYLTNERCKVWFTAETMWNNVISQFPNDAEGYKDRGGYLVEINKYDVDAKANDFDRAFNDFSIAIQMKNGDPKIYSNRGNIYALRGKYDLSLADYSKSIELDSSDFNVYLNRGITYSIMEKYDSAFADWEKVLRIHGPEVKLYQNRAYAFLKAGKFKDAVDDYTKLTEMGIRMDATMYFFRAFANFKLGNYDAAISDNSRAIQMKPDYKEAYFNRAQTYLSMKKPKNALDDILQAKSMGYNMDPAIIEQIRKQL